MKKIILILAIALGCVNLSKAQTYYGNDSYMKQIIMANYQMSVPVGHSRDFIQNMSFGGLNLSWEYFVTHHLTVGASFTYNNYNRKLGQRIYRPTPDMAINAAQFRYTQVFPLKVNVRGYFNPDGFIKTYAGLGIGALSAGEHIVIQDIDEWNNSWGFLISPEVGALIPFGRNANYGANVGIGYNYSTNKTDFADIKINGRNSFYFNIGLYLALY